MPFVLILFPLLLLLLLPASSYAAPTCLGQKVDRVVRGQERTVRVAYRDVVWVEGNMRIIGKPYSVICADEGDQTIWAGKGSSRISTGGGNDTVRLHLSSWQNTVILGDGDDQVWGSRGHDKIRSGPGKDWVLSRGGNDQVWDTGGEGNEIRTGSGSDSVWSTGGQSFVWGGNGTDFLRSDGGSGSLREELFGERGNDRLLADWAPSDGPALLDPGPGDDWIRGTSFDDTILFQSGLKKVQAGAGNDLLLSSGRGSATVWGDEGEDTVSFAAWTPPEENSRSDGLWIEDNTVRGLRLEGWENIIGSAFDDNISSTSGTKQTIRGGMGDDDLRGQFEDGDRVWGGTGRNSCQGFAEIAECDKSAPVQEDGLYADLDLGGVLLVRSGDASDSIQIEAASGGYQIFSNHPIQTLGSCEPLSDGALCTGTVHSIIVYGDDGGDQISLGASLPQTLTTTLDGGRGVNTIQGGPSKDTIQTKQGFSAGSLLRGGGGVDNIYVQDNVLADGEEGNDVIHSKNPCWGGSATGSAGRDNLVFAGADSGVWASIEAGRAAWRTLPCALPLAVDQSIEALEGTAHNDHLRLGARFLEQEGPGKLLGREGIDILDARNGHRDAVTTGSGGKQNRVLADPEDTIIWGWGLSGY